MRQRLIAVTLVLTLLLATSVEMLAAPVRVGNVLPLHNQFGQNFCTAWHINAKSELWATAGHCAAAAMKRGFTMMISGKRAELIYIQYNEQMDVAILHVEGLVATPIKLAAQAPKQLDKATIAGYPYGFPILTITSGHVAARNVPISPMAPISDIYDIAVAGGNSGSPVLNDKGEAIGLLWGAFTDSPHSLGIPWESLRQAAGQYFGK